MDFLGMRRLERGWHANLCVFRQQREAMAPPSRPLRQTPACRGRDGLDRLEGRLPGIAAGGCQAVRRRLSRARICLERSRRSCNIGEEVMSSYPWSMPRGEVGLHHELEAVQQLEEKMLGHTGPEAAIAAGSILPSFSSS